MISVHNFFEQIQLDNRDFPPRRSTFRKLEILRLSYYGVDKPPPDRLPMTPVEEEKLFKRYARVHCPVAREKLIRRYLCWAFKIASKLKGPRLSHDEAIGAANLGLVEALDTFKPQLGYRFATYSYFVIRRHVIEALISSYPVHVSSHMRKKLRKLEKAGKLSKVEAGITEDPRTLDEIFDRLGEVSEFDVSLLYDRPEDIPTLPAPEVDPADACEESNKASLVKEYLASSEFTPLERAALTARHYKEPLESFEAIGKRLRVAKKRVRESYDSGLIKLRLHFAN